MSHTRPSRSSSVGFSLFRTARTVEEIPFYRPIYIAARNKFDELKKEKAANGEDGIDVGEKDIPM